MEYTDLIKILNGDIRHIDNVNEYDDILHDTRIIITPELVRKCLLEYLAGSIAADDLIKWAKFICGRLEYVVPDCDDSDQDYFEAMYYVIQCLSTPELDGEVNQAQVKIYLSELDKYFELS